MEFEKYKYFTSIFLRLKYLISFTSFLQFTSIATDSFANPPSAVDCIQLVPKYLSKVKLSREQSPNILSEIIKSQENGSEGTNFSTGTFP